MQRRTFPAVRAASRKTLGRIFIAAIFGLLIILFLCPSLSAQSQVKISGQVIDAVSGAPIPGATVSIEGSGRSVATDGSGRFRFVDLPVGEYRISASRIGYAWPDAVEAEVDPFSETSVVIEMVPSPVKAPDQLVTGELPDLPAVRREGNKTIVRLPSGMGSRLEEIVQRIPELEIVESGARKFLRIRGADLKGTVVMLDGRVINSILTSKGDISTIPLGSVNRVEIVTGGGHSAGGLAGSVNFITADPGGSRSVAAAADRGSFGMESYGLRSSGYEIGGLNMTLEAVDDFYRGDFEFVDPRDSMQTRLNNFSRTRKLFCSAGLLSDGTTMNLKARYFSRRAGVPGPIFQLSPEAESETEEKEIYATLTRRIRNNVDLNLVTGITERRAEYESPRSATSFIAYSTRFDELSRDARFELHRTGRLDITGYFDIRYESLEGIDHIRPASSLGSHSRLVDAQGLGVSYRLPAAGRSIESSVTSIGMRREGGDRGIFWAPSATSRLNLDLPGNPGIDVSYSRGRRLPDLADLYWKEDVFATPNPDLQPEISKSLEAGLDFGFTGRLSTDLRASHFVTDYENLIVWRRWAGDKFKPVNLSRARISGWNISLRSRPFGGPISLRWSAGFVKPLNKEPELSHYDKFLTFRPIGTQNAAIEFEFEDLRARVAGRHYGRRYTTEENSKSLGAVDLVDLELAWSLQYRTVDVQFTAAIDNLGNIQYEILDRQPEKPREYKASIEISYTGGSDE
jgi:outer membrane cobalamin receptor